MKYILNETPVKTTNGFRINNINVDIDIPVVEKFNIFNINSTEMDKLNISIDKVSEPINSRIGLDTNTDYKLSINVDNFINLKENVDIEYHFNKEFTKMVSLIEINVGENSNGTFTIKFVSDDDSYNFSYLKQITTVGNNSNVIVNILPIINKLSASLVAIENEVGENSKVVHNYYDLSGKTRISNYFTDLKNNTSENILNNIYIGNDEDIIDMNYVTLLKGIKTNTSMRTVGSINNKCQKSYKATIDFVEGCKKAIAREHENCIILSDKAVTKSLPMMLCHEEDVDGSHAVSSGKIDPKQLFYLMTRGLSKKEALKVIVNASFNKLLNEQKDDTIKELIVEILKREL